MAQIVSVSQAADKIISDKIPVVIGGEMSEEAIVLSEKLGDKKIVLMTPTASTPRVTDDRPYTFRACFSDRIVANAPAEYVMKKFALKAINIIHNVSSPYSDFLSTQFAAILNQHAEQPKSSERPKLFIQKETRRVSIARQQVLQFFQNQHSVIAEEMWTRNLESIALRVANITTQLGNAEYELTLADEQGKCLLKTNTAFGSQNCKNPEEFLRFMNGHPPPADPAMLLYDERVQRNIYMVPIYVGEVRKGYLHASVSD